MGNDDGTLPRRRRAPAGARAFASAACAIVFVVSVTRNGGLAASAALAAHRLSLAFVYASSIVLEAMPFVVAGTLVAFALRRHPRARAAAPLLAMLSPGCDCGLSGITPAFPHDRPAIAGFALTWGAVAGPTALIATGVAFGGRMVAARIAGAAAAALLTAIGWRALPSRSALVESCDAPRPLACALADAFASLAWASVAASLLCAFAPVHVLRDVSPLGAATIASVLSPCSTADAMIAKSLVRLPAAQAAFIVAAQCVDIRQLALIYRSFGPVHAIAAFLAGAAGCAAAALAAG